VFPYCAVVLVYSAAFGPGTGWLYGPDIVATAGHCLNTGEQVWVPLTGKYPLRIGYRTQPGEPYRWCGARRLYSARGWTDGGDERYDYGAIALDRDIGSELGWLGVGWTDRPLTGHTATHLGYGMRRWQELRTESDFDPIQLAGHGHVRDEIDGQTFYDIPTDRGSSGGPILVDGLPPGCVAAIHTTAAHPDDDSLPAAHRQYSHGTAVSKYVFDNLIAWRDHRD